eukprot:Hpha_TRINITY_DN18559_c0_g1::TRINITY_DN18559_c0_g1_i1::g.195194::m.195194
MRVRCMLLLNRLSCPARLNRVYSLASGQRRRPTAPSLKESSASSMATVTVVDNTNFDAALRAIKSALSEADFVSFDCEYTGVPLEQNAGKSALRTADATWRAMRRAIDPISWANSQASNNPRVQRFAVVQVGLACFHWDPGAARYRASAWAFYVQPAWGKRSADVEFSCLGSSLGFLQRHGFDFGRWLSHGIATRRRCSLGSSPGVSGMLTVWEAVLRSGVPLVGHQCLLDLMLLWLQWEGPLPAGLDDWATALRRLRGREDPAKALGLFDTKHIVAQHARVLAEKALDHAAGESSEEAGRALKALGLADLWHVFSSHGGGSCAPILPDDLGAHNAGYDALLTGMVFGELRRVLPAELFDREVDHLNVYAAPFSLALGATQCRPLAETHGVVAVVEAPEGEELSRAELEQAVGGDSEVHWLKYPVAGVLIGREAGDAQVWLKRLVEAGRGWRVSRAVDFVNRRRRRIRERLKGTARGEMRRARYEGRMRAKAMLREQRAVKSLQRAVEREQSAAQSLRETQDKLRAANRELQVVSKGMEEFRQQSVRLMEQIANAGYHAEAKEEPSQPSNTRPDARGPQTEGLARTARSRVVAAGKIGRQHPHPAMRGRAAQPQAADSQTGAVAAAGKLAGKWTPSPGSDPSKAPARRKRGLFAGVSDTKDPRQQSTHKGGEVLQSPKTFTGRVDSPRPGLWEMEVTGPASGGREDHILDCPGHVTSTWSLDLSRCNNIRIFVPGLLLSCMLRDCENVDIVAVGYVQTKGVLSADGSPFPIDLKVTKFGGTWKGVRIFFVPLADMIPGREATGAGRMFGVDCNVDASWDPSLWRPVSTAVIHSYPDPVGDTNGV